MAKGEATGLSESFHLIRYSHIFASAVREILELRLVEEVCPALLSLSQFHLLKLMVFNGQHQVGEVADFLGVSAPAASKNIDKVEALDLVIRRSSKGTAGRRCSPSARKAAGWC